MAESIGKGRRMSAAIVGTILVAAILILINVIFSGTLIRLDLTEGKEFTISEATREILGDLEDLVTITVYMSADMPPQLSTLRRQVSDMLDEYRNYGRGKVQVDFVDPAGDPELERRLRMLGIPQIQAQTVERDQLQVVNIYLGLSVTYLDQQEVLPVIEDTYALEYDLTAAILKVSREEEDVVGILAGPVLHELSTDMTGLNELLQRQFTIRSVDLGEGEESVPEEIDLLIVAGPNSVPDRIEYQLDQFLMRGGHVLFLVDPIRLPEGGGLQAMPVTSGIEDLLAHYGVRVQKAMALDRAYCSTASFAGGFVRYTVPYPYWPKAIPELLNQEHPITNRLESLTLPWTAPLEVDVPIAEGDPLPRIRELERANEEARREIARQLGVELEEDQATEAGADTSAGSATADLATRAAADTAAAAGEGDALASPRAHVLVRTSPSAWQVSGRYDLNPQQPFRPTGETDSEVLAVALQGRFDSYFAERNAPPLPSAAADSAAAVAAPTETPLVASPETRLLVVGNAQFATDTFLGQFPANSVFLLNAIDWMTFGDQLISIRSRGATERPLASIADAAKSRIKLACILGAPLLVVLYGVLRATHRRRRRSAQEVAARDA